MNTKKLSDAEMEVMKYIWEKPGISALEIDAKLQAEGLVYGKNLYSYLARCIKKGAVERREPGYRCYPLLKKEEPKETALNTLLRRMFANSPSALVQTLVGENKISEDELKKIKEIITDMGDGK